MLSMKHNKTAKDILSEAQKADCVAVNKCIMRELGGNAALLYALMLEAHESVKKGGDAGTRNTLLGRIKRVTRLSEWDMACAIEELERAGVIDDKDDKFCICVIDKISAE